MKTFDRIFPPIQILGNEQLRYNSPTLKGLGKFSAMTNDVKIEKLLFEMFVYQHHYYNGEQYNYDDAKSEYTENINALRQVVYQRQHNLCWTGDIKLSSQVCPFDEIFLNSSDTITEW